VVNRVKLIFLTLFLAAYSISVYANARINSVTMSPPAPDYHQAVTVTIDYCAQLYNDNYMAMAFSTSSAFQNAALSGVGQVFVISNRGVDVPVNVPATSPGGRIDWLANPSPGGGTAECRTCDSGSNNGKHFVATYVVHVPGPEYFPGCSNTSLNLLVGMKDANLNEGDWTALSGNCDGTDANNSNSWTIPVPPANVALQKRAEGVITNVGDMVLFSMDYTFGNSVLSIDDPLPGGGNLEVVSWGPKTINLGSVSGSGAVVGATSGNITWNFPTRVGQAGSANGTVWVLMRVKNAMAPGTTITNTATANGSVTASTSIVVGQAAFTISKTQSINPPDKALVGSDIITYYLEYSVNGYQMKSYRPFDDTAAGSYTSPVPPAGWKYLPDGASGQSGTWTIADPCNTGDSYITGQGESNQHYPQLLLDDPAGNTANVQFCTGIIMADVMIDPGGYEGSDAMVILRSNNNGGTSNAYGLLLSVDNAPLNGYVGIQKCSNGGTCSWYNGGVTANVAGISNKKWFRTKTQITQAGNDYVFQVKVWIKGDPEPDAWTMTWTDTGAAADPNWNCTSGIYHDWRPGIAEQRGASGATEDSYNNFVVYIPNTSANTIIYDTIPNGLSYMSSNPLGTNAGGVVSWTLNNVSNQSGTFTWWGLVSSCNIISNVADITGGLSAVNIESNSVWVDVICGTPTFTPTPTATKTDTPLPGTPTNTPTITPSFTDSPTFTNTSTQTMTPTATPTLTPAPANIELTLIPIDTSVQAGECAQINVIVINTGLAAAQNVQVSADVPAGTTFDPACSTDNSGWTLTGNVISYNTVLTLNPGGQQTLSYYIRTDPATVSGTLIPIAAATAVYSLYPGVPLPVVTATSAPTFITVGDIIVYPNPFNPKIAMSGACKFANLPKDTIVAIYTISGELVYTNKNSLAYIYWYGVNNVGKKVSPGVYYYTITWDDGHKKMLGKLFVVSQ
jgi:uncharacterized repeat protein (TIGR01451 family)